ncbi:peptide ABC transporter substrate-binding protein [Pseudobdellovibrio exovorus]|uniref:ABC transporter, substrate binding protein n=1 Tax=Pseudobdellovibrio exovorus JSS TaxID=1184267 RepID=M4V8T0_9BACT|nr:peptide ABC transporter substrate-binding protein [Pseudobdellovibrio exovorus]AGH95618.1 ABC transporter, substrate binding protein [Pseudobdellovibrio exovorus JSS]
MKKSIRVLSAAILLLTLSCTKKETAAPADGSAPAASTTTSSSLNNTELKIGISQEFENFNPLIATMLATTIMQKMVNRTLVTIDADGKWVPQLAKSIPTLENGGAKLVTVGGVKKIEATWEILDNAAWGDGTPVTCADFAFAVKVASAATVSIGEKEVYTQVEKITAPADNPKKCTFTYEKPKWDFYQLGTFYPLPKHIEEKVFNTYGTENGGYEKNSVYVKDPYNKGLYNGPYLMTDIQLGDHVTFAPNPTFYGEAPKIQKIIVKLIPNTGTMEANLRSGTIDMISTLGLALDQALAFEKKVKAENLPYNVLFQPSTTYEHIDLNLDHPALADIKVRKALNYSINRQELVQSLFEGKQPPAIHNITPKDPWYTDDPSKVVIYNYSPRDAEKLLDEAGWKRGSDGIRTKNGKRLSFTLMTTAGNKTRELVQVYLQNGWKQVGIEVNAKNEPARVFFGETTKKRLFDSMALFAWISSPENNPKSTFLSTNVPSAKNGYSGQNHMNWKNKKVDELLLALDAEFSHEKRVQLIHEILKYYTDEVPVLPLYYRSDVAVIPTQLKNYRLTGHQFPETNQVEKWTLE